MLTGKVLKEKQASPVGLLKDALKRLGEPVIRQAVNRAMKEMGQQFVLGGNIKSALKRAEKNQQKGYNYSFDMLGEAAKTDDDAIQYHLAYSQAITSISTVCHNKSTRDNPGISVKLSALYPRYEVTQREQVLEILVPRVQALALLAKSAGIGLTIDAEEADRLMLSLEIIEKVLSDKALLGWDGFGVVIQAYGKRASEVIDWLYKLTLRLDQYITVRLVKGAYWDSEIKKSQIEGMNGFPVFTTKSATDISYIANAKRLLTMTDRIYPQFATHNSHTMAAILEMAPNTQCFEFQRLHGMGEQLHRLILEQENTRCRIYAPVGAHQDLLAYLVRRLLENGANSSFVNQLVDKKVAPEVVCRDPFSQIEKTRSTELTTGKDIFKPERINSMGWDLSHWPTIKDLQKKRERFFSHQWQASPLIAQESQLQGVKVEVKSPSNENETIGTVQQSTQADIEIAIASAQCWALNIEERRKVLNTVADLLEENHVELFSLLAKKLAKPLQMLLPKCVKR